MRDLIRGEHLRLELVSERILATCWTAMAEKGARITAMKSPVAVHNFAMQK